MLHRSRFSDVLPDPMTGQLLLRPGDIAPEVGDWQQQLVWVGYPSVMVNGFFDNATTAATLAFKAFIAKAGFSMSAGATVDDAARAAMAERLDARFPSGPPPIGPVVRGDNVDVSGRRWSTWWLGIPLLALLFGGSKRNRSPL